MERYKDYVGTRKTSDGTRQYETLRYPNLENKDTDIWLYGKFLLRLDKLAFDYYGDVTLWPIIARANRLGKGTIMVPPGKRIRIPYPLPIDELQNAFFNINERD